MNTPDRTLIEKLGIALGAPAQPPDDKSVPLSDLAKEDVKNSRHSPSRQVAEDLPATPPNGAYLSTGYRLALRISGAVEFCDPSLLSSPAQAQRTRSHTEASMKNQFRVSLEKLPPIRAVEGTARADVRPRLDLLTRALFVEEANLDLTSLASAILPSKSGAPTDANFYTAYRQLVDDGRIQVAWSGRGGGGGTTPHAFDLQTETPFARTCNLGTVLSTYLGSGVSPTVARSALAATRLLLVLPPYSSAQRVVCAARDIPCESFHGLPTRFAEDHRETAAHSRKTIQNATASLRALVAFGVARDLFPLFFPRLRPSNAWNALIDETFPLSSTGRTDADTLSVRSGLNALFQVARTELAIAHPSGLSPASVSECYRRLTAPQHRSARSRVDNLLKVFRKVSVPFKNSPVIQLIADTLTPRRRTKAIPYLEAPDGIRLSTGTLSGFSELLALHGFSREWPEFFEWYRDYSLSGFRELLARSDEFPDRPSARKLKPLGFESRIAASRAYLGVARAVFPETYSHLTPSDVFGRHFKRLTSELLTLWEASADHANGVSHRASAGLHHLICGGGRTGAPGTIASPTASRTEHTAYAP